MSTENRRLAAIMFTDIVGYSALSQRNEDLALSVLGEHRALLEPIFRDFDGEIVKSTGDGYLAEFASAIQAVRCAVEMQTAVRQRNEQSAPDRQFLIRIGIHVGDVVHQDGDVLGDGVNIASRIEPLAEPGGICISEQVYDHVHNKVELHIVNLGQKALKNISSPLEVYRVFLPWEETPKVRKVVVRLPRPGRSLGARLLIGAAPVAIALAVLFAFPNLISERPGVFEPQDDVRTVAVLPFRDLSEGMDAAYFSDGITEEIINALSNLKGVRVPARTSAFLYKESSKDLDDIAKELGVEAVLEGSVRTDGNHFRISARLSDVRTDTLLWSEIFDREMKNIFSVQDEITKKIVSTLKVSLGVAEETPLVVAKTEDMEAYQCYLKGREAWNDRSEDGFQKALSCFQNAVDHDPRFAQAYAGLADTFHLMERYGHIPTEEGRKKAKENALKAIELDPNLSAAHTSLAAILEYEWDFEGAEAAFKKALELEPNSVLASQWYASLLSKLGRFDEAVNRIEQAVMIDPMNIPLMRSHGTVLAAAGRNEEAEAMFRKTLEMDENFPWTRAQLAVLVAQRGGLEEARELIRTERERFGSDAELEAHSAYVERLAGTPDPGGEFLRAAASSKEGASAFSLALLHSIRGEVDEAYQQLEKGIEVKDFGITLLQTLPGFDPIREDPRYETVLERIGLADRKQPQTKI